ncbi:hypothetical protein EWM64_g10195 [Hericium alpestre]|uniref:Uncharacterized protein n=1 Tax=Hericium alpestre TaxID=135208 RepID=A0A4Y9ZIG6_9AGAM|nr:hypothetical protein EWM64_g10195 [Hericium alpestre]
MLAALFAPLALSLSSVLAMPLAARQTQPAPGCTVSNVAEFGLVAQYASGLQKELVLTGNGNDSSATAWLGTRSLLQQADVLGVNFTMTYSGLTSTTWGGLYVRRYDAQLFSNEIVPFEAQKGKNESPDNIYCLQESPDKQTYAYPLLAVYDNTEGFYVCDSATSDVDELVVYSPFPSGNPSEFKGDTCEQVHIMIVQGEI